MLRLFKNIKIAYFASAISGALILIVLFSFMLESDIGAIFTPFLWIIACAIFFTVRASKKMKLIMDARDNCRIAEFIYKNEMLLFECKNKNLADTLKLNLFAGCRDIGDIKKSEQYLNSIQPTFPIKGNGIVSYAIFYMDLFLMYSENGELDKAETALNTAKHYIDNPTLNPVSRDNALKYWKNHKVSLDILKGNYEGSERHFLLELETEKTMLGRVSMSYKLADINMHYGNTDKAAGYCDFIIKNGGDTRYVAKAKELLQRINTTD